METQNSTKLCFKCHRALPLSEFHRHKRYPDGLQKHCKDCGRAYSKSPARKAYIQEWQRANRDKLRAADKRWSENHPDRVAAKRVARKLKRPAYFSEYYAANKDRIRDKGIAYYTANKDRVQAKNRAWHKANPDKSRAGWMRYRARKHNVTIGPVDFIAILARDGWVCHICGDFVTRPELSFDHIIPLNKGGAHTEDNLAVAHLTCNKSKGDRLGIKSALPPRIRRRH